MDVRKTKLAEINVGRERGKEEGEWGAYIEIDNQQTIIEHFLWISNALSPK